LAHHRLSIVHWNPPSNEARPAGRPKPTSEHLRR
jgi:hypothetical protein